MPKCQRKDFEDLTVEIAEMEIVKRARYQKLNSEEEDPEVKYISQWLRRNTRAIDCKIADNTDPLRGIFAFKSDPF
jgi:hypothetical protein